MILEFPKGFYWGAATSAHQVEGNNLNSWSEWEKSESRIQNLESRIKDPNFKKSFPQHVFEKWPTPLDKENYISGRACDHYHRFREDFDIVKSLGHNAHRFSIEWSRIEPEEGKFDEKEIEHYRQVILALKERGLEPFITLYHWTHPLWFEKRGAWLNKKAAHYFEKFVEKFVNSCQDLDVKFWITINEPLVFTSNSYLTGKWPPAKRSLLSYFKVLKCLKNAHLKAYSKIKEANQSNQVGVAKNNIYFSAEGGSASGGEVKFINLILKKLADFWWNFLFLNKTRLYQDFIGLNYYYHNRIKNFRFNQNENREVSDLGWEIYPQGIYYVLKDLKKYNKPIYITENGLADANDEKREKFIKEHLFWVHKAIQEGIDIRGYFHWSLLDNFEWDKGFWPRFGLVEVDYKTMERKIRPSALKYKDIIVNNSLDI